ncbi:universal stress protein [Novosphingobium sp. M1R2S20]|uniref:Universal stress protein n=1 Tax=Novosphingobium rhizovicinum TaxID=3228928 RepID=A0ABV3RFH2_9SPHN
MRDILLQANSHPEPTPEWAMEAMAALANLLDAKASLGVCQVHIPPVSSWLANTLLNVDGTIAAENSRSEENAQILVAAFKAILPQDRLGQCTVVECPGMVTPWQLAIRARTHDLTVVPVYGHAETRSVAEGLVFESGHPVLLLPHASAQRLDRVAVAWDGSSVAARALSDAMSLLHRASVVKIVQITGDKDLSKTAPVADVIRNLEWHGITAQSVNVPADGMDAAAALQSYCTGEGLDLLVMGAFGHSRAREFVLGGVTRSILDAPALPVLISH